MAMKFNKMFITLPIMFAARKLDAENPTVVYWLRVIYMVIQSISIAIVGYAYLQATAVKDKSSIVYVPAPAMPFADPTAKKKYTEVAFGNHVVTTARNLLGSTIFGAVLTLGLHYYKGMVVGLAIQAAMAPFNLYENALVKALFMGDGLREEDRIFEEKTPGELTADDEVVDDKGNPVVRSLGRGGSSAHGGSSEVSLEFYESIILDTWDAGAKADLTSLMASTTKKNCNHQTKEDNWTPMMILAGLRVSGTASAIRQLKQLGGNPAVVDKEGWTALHWAAFHGNVDAARELRKDQKVLSVKDKEGHTPIDTARKEGNEEVAKLFEDALGESKKSK